MSNLTRFNPFDDITRFEPWRGMEEAFKGLRGRPWLKDLLEIEAQIRMDVTESDKEYAIKAEVPGVKKEDIHVAMDGNQVTVTAEVKKEKEEKKGETTLRSERYVGRQYRSFALGHDIDASKAEAKYQDGVLELKLPKKSNGQSREVRVQ